MAPNLPPAVARLVETVSAEKRLTPKTCKRLLSESGITAQDLAPWSDFDHPRADSYGRQMVFDGGYFELMVMSWRDGDMAAIHDHGYTQWGAVKVLGRTEHAIFKLRDGILTTAERRIFEPGSVVAVNHDLIHQMGNVGQYPYLTLHLYGCHGRSGDVTADARLYELDENKIQITTGGVFFALPEDAIDRRIDGPPADFPTRLRYKVELLKRLIIKNDSWKRGSLRSTREARLAYELESAEMWQGARHEMSEMRGSESLRRVRYFDILDQELHATARLQLALCDRGLVRGGLASRRNELIEILNESDSATFGKRYIDLIGETLAIDFPVTRAA